MNGILTPQQCTDQARFRAHIHQVIAPQATNFDQQEQLSGEMIQELATQGYLGALLPVEYGGAGQDLLTFGLLNAELGRGCTAVRSLVSVQNMIATAILNWGDTRLKENWLPQLASGQVIGAFALSEPEVGSDARNIQASATLIGEHYRLNGHKKWISFGQVADLLLTFAQSPEGMVALLVARDTPGLVIRPLRGLLGARASMLAEIEYHDCQVPATNLVGTPGFGFVPVALQALDLGRYSIAWGSVGMAEACLEASLSYARRRRQFGVQIGQHQLIQQIITDMAVQVKAAWQLCWQAGQCKTKQAPDAFLETMFAKYYATRMASKVASDAIQIHGANGCTTDYPFERFLRDAKMMEIIEGSTQIHQTKIAEYLIQHQTRP
ncbi:MAG: acyl-CoA dehydrogenase family protein [Anaerolineales bacterium]|nr:acyl-CoA dehydrogenase family protein [Anaerolineales bacterium]